MFRYQSGWIKTAFAICSLEALGSLVCLFWLASMGQLAAPSFVLGIFGCFLPGITIAAAAIILPLPRLAVGNTVFSLRTIMALGWAFLTGVLFLVLPRAEPFFVRSLLGWGSLIAALMSILLFLIEEADWQTAISPAVTVRITNIVMMEGGLRLWFFPALVEHDEPKPDRALRNLLTPARQILRAAGGLRPDENMAMTGSGRNYIDMAITKHHKRAQVS